MLRRKPCVFAFLLFKLFEVESFVPGLGLVFDLCLENPLFYLIVRITWATNNISVECKKKSWFSVEGRVGFLETKEVDRPFEDSRFILETNSRFIQWSGVCRP